MKDRNVVSLDRARASQILIQEFLTFPFIIDEIDAVIKTASILGIKPNTALRYLRNSGIRPKYSKILLDIDDKSFNDNLLKVSDIDRAIFVLHKNGFSWEEIGKQIKQRKMSKEAIRIRYRRAVKKTSVLINISPIVN